MNAHDKRIELEIDILSVKGESGTALVLRSLFERVKALEAKNTVLEALVSKPRLIDFRIGQNR